ncbi:MAG: hypothetical protein ACU837_06885 [Gammaproteobacteria bacterium]
MGAEPYYYKVDYEEDLQHALDSLRRRVFEQGEYHGAENHPATPDAALQQASASGTRSILDILKISDEPDYCCAAPFSDEEMELYFETDRPSVELFESDDFFWEDIPRGQARYLIGYENGKPAAIYFMGYSFD